MKRLGYLFFILLFFLNGKAQESASGEMYQVRGMVCDSLTCQPEMYVTLRIYDPSFGEPIRIFVSDDQGRFESSLPRPGKYILQATSVGKETLMHVFTLQTGSHRQDLGQLWMKDDVKQLGEVSVYAAKPLVKTEIDKTIYSLEDDPDALTSTLIEMLRKVPLVSVDGEEKIRVEGNTSFRIYMNGKPSNMLSNNPTEVLRSIPAYTVKKIEVITDPGARYDAEGVSGILNIVTKGAELEGYNVNLNAQWMNRSQGAGGFATLKYGRLSVAANYAFNRYTSKIKESYYRWQINHPEEERLSSFSNIRAKTPGHYAGLEGSYELDSLNLLSVSGAINLNKRKDTYASFYRMEDHFQTQVYSYREDQTDHQHWGSGSFKMDYQHLFNQKKSEMITLSYQYDYSPDDRNTYTSRLDREGDSPSLEFIYDRDKQLNRAKRHEHTLQLDYLVPLVRFFSFVDRHQLESGLKYIRRNNLSKAFSYIQTGTFDTWEPAPSQSVLDYRHIQNIMALYAGYAFYRGKWAANGGLRMEHTWQNVQYKKGEGEDFEYKVTDWVPAFTASYKMSDRHQLQMGYTVRMRRPGINFLNPYVFITGSGIRYGNPTLTSEKQQRLTLTYNYLSAKVNLQVRGLYTVGKNCIGNYQFIADDGILNDTYGNIAEVQGGGVSGYMGYSPTPTLSLSVNGVMNYLSTRAETGQTGRLSGQHNEGFCGGLYVNFSQKWRKTWRLAVGGGYGHPEPKLGMDPFHHYFYTVALAKTFLDDRLTLNLRLQNIFTPSITLTTHQRYADFQSVTDQRRYEREVGFSVSYRFGSLKTQVRKVLRSILNDDLIEKER